MKHNKANNRSFPTVCLAILVALTIGLMPGLASASGGSGSGGGSGGSGGTTTKVDTIKVSKCYYFDTGSYVELLINAGSSDSTAHLYAFLPSGAYLGEVQNGGGGRYGGTVFVTLGIPTEIGIISSSGGSIIVPCVPGQL